MARSPPQSGDHGAIVSVTDTPWQYGLSPSLPSPQLLFQLVASGARRHIDPCQLCLLYVASPAGGGAPAQRRTELWCPENRRDVSGDPQVAAGPVDVRAS